MARIAIFSAPDYTWSFEAWKKTIPELQKKHTLLGIYIFPNQLGKLKGIKITLWYFRVFGFWSAVILGLHAIRTRCQQLFTDVKTWSQLADKYGLVFNTANTPNDPAVAQWVKENNIDVVLITVGQVLKKEILAAPRIGIINKHAAMLPAGKGLFPFLSAHINGAPTGVTFHQVEEKIDTGGILVQEEYPREQSMLRFYMQVFQDFPGMVNLAVERLISGEYLKPRGDILPSYYGLPTSDDVKRSGVKIAQWSDLFYEVRRD